MLCGSSQTGRDWTRRGLADGLPVELEEGAAVAAGRPGGGGHAGERADAGAAGEAEEDRLGLVVAGVAEEDGGGAVAFGGGVQRGVAGVAGGGLGAALASDVHGDGLDGVEVHGGEPGDDLGGAETGSRLEVVVDGDAAGPDGEFAGLEREGGGERHGVGAAGAGDEHEGVSGRAGSAARGLPAAPASA